MDLLCRMSEWLRANEALVGRTVPMPLCPGKKEPMFRHAGMPWGWREFDAFYQENPAHADWGLLLDRLCAVDADDPETVRWLEEELSEEVPELLTCPVQETRKGRHYLMVRPAFADEEAFYDGARQRREGEGRPKRAVDFKSVCSTGTRGLLCVAPTAGKTWLAGRAPWDDQVRIAEMPRRLLEEVAAPRGDRPRPSCSPARETKQRERALDPRVVGMLKLLAKRRWDDYGAWRDVATALKNDDGDAYFEKWLELSAASDKFDAQAARTLWASVAREAYSGPRLTRRSLQTWAMSDDPAGYQALRAGMVPAFVLRKYSEGDRGLAEIAHHLLRKVIKRVGSKSTAIYYFDEEECRWVRGDEASVMLRISFAVEEALKDVDAHLAARAAALSADEHQQQRASVDDLRRLVAERISYVRKKNGMANITSIAARLCQDDGFEQLLDSRLHLIGVRNGVVDLRDGTLRPRTPEDMILTVLDVDYSPDASTELVERTALSIMAGDPEMAAFLQKLLGYAITGEVSEEIFVVFTAGGRNGKGLLMQTLMDLMGPLYVEMNCGILVNRQVANIDAERGKLKGARVAVFNELEPGEKLKTSEMQLLSGGDGIPATPKYCDPMTIQPRHLSILTTNHMPELSEVRVAAIERMLVVLFPVTFVDLAEGEAPTPKRQQRDNTLKQKLAENKAGFLTWLVRGATLWYRTKDLKRNAPLKVKEFSRKYFEEQDRLAAFLQENCVAAEDQCVVCRVFYEEYAIWSKAENGGGKPADAGGLAKAMEAKGFPKKKSRIKGYANAVACFQGIALINNTAS